MFKKPLFWIIVVIILAVLWFVFMRQRHDLTPGTNTGQPTQVQPTQPSDQPQNQNQGQDQQNQNQDQNSDQNQPQDQQQDQSQPQDQSSDQSSQLQSPNNPAANTPSAEAKTMQLHAQSSSNDDKDGIVTQANNP